MLAIGIGTTVAVRCVTYFGTRYGREGLQACIVVCAILAILALPLTWTANWLTLGVRDRPNYFGANIYSLAVPVSMFSSLLAATLLVERKVGLYWVNECITAGLTAVFVILLAGFHALTATTFAVGALIAVSTAVVATASLQRSINRNFRFPERRLVVNAITYALKLCLTLVPLQLTMRLDQLVVLMAAPMKTLGTYSIAVAWSSVLATIGVGFSTVVLSDSAYVDLTSSSDIEVATARLRRAAIVVVTVGVLTCFAAPLAIPLLYGSQFRGAIAPAMILSVATIPLYITMMLHEFSRGVGLPSVGWLPEAAGVAVAVLALKVLFFRYGILGAAAASLVTYSVILALLLSRLGIAIELFRVRSLMPRMSDFVAVWVTSREVLQRTFAGSAAVVAKR
jgi:O-antigen/teichoic acid export membrane protein